MAKKSAACYESVFEKLSIIFKNMNLIIGSTSTLFLRELPYINHYKDSNIEKAAGFLSNGIIAILQ